jgi:hypothetical protein
VPTSTVGTTDVIPGLRGGHAIEFRVLALGRVRRFPFSVLHSPHEKHLAGLLALPVLQPDQTPASFTLRGTLPADAEPPKLPVAQNVRRLPDSAAVKTVPSCCAARWACRKKTGGAGARGAKPTTLPTTGRQHGVLPRKGTTVSPRRLAGCVQTAGSPLSMITERLYATLGRCSSTGRARSRIQGGLTELVVAFRQRYNRPLPRAGDAAGQAGPHDFVKAHPNAAQYFRCRARP